MKYFIIKTLLLAALMISLITTSLFVIPNIAIQNSLLGALSDKHSMLTMAGSPKIVFVGGSNLSFGLDSKVISEHFKLPVVNTSLHAGVGLKYFASDVLPYINKGDIVILSPEYQHFYTDLFYGDMELVAVLFDIFQEGRKFVDLDQWFHLVGLIPRYAISKLKFHNGPEEKPGDIYSRKSFNAYGDAYLHWSLPRTKIEHAKPSTEKDVVNLKSIGFLKDFSDQIRTKEATFVILPPVYATTSFNNQRILITSIERALNTAGLAFISDPHRYKFPDSLFFNTNYHLTKSGIDIRTKLIVADLSRVGLRN